MLSFLPRAGLTVLTFGMLTAFGWVGSAEAAHCATIFKMSLRTDSLGTTMDSNISNQDTPLPARPIPTLQVPFDFQPGTGTCDTNTGPIRGAGSTGQALVAVPRVQLFSPELVGRMPIPTDLMMTNASTTAIFEPPRLCV